ncbi:MAG: hypothetical protein HY908_30065 [Myxococcales bacterium]|nr:hypothetical protein [Myxococcales bacterium]
MSPPGKSKDAGPAPKTEAAEAPGATGAAPGARPPKKKHAARDDREKAAAEARSKIGAQDPLAPAALKKLGLRIGLIVAGLWVIALIIPTFIPKIVAGVLTLIVGGVVLWVLRFSRRSYKVAEIVRSADTAEARKEALGKLASEFKSGDVAATFARAQLQMQEDPRTALRTLETINLGKVMATVADETRSQRALIHLMLGETAEARSLCDGIELGRHKEPKTRAMLGTIIGESWARTGQAARAVELLETFDANDPVYKDLRPQLLRALCFAYAWSNKSSAMKQTLRKLAAENTQLLFGFVTKRKNPAGVSPRGIHPALEKEAYDMVMRSGMVPRKMQVKRMG